MTLASTTVLLYPLYHPAAALYTPVDAEGAGGRLLPAPGPARPDDDRRAANEPVRSPAGAGRGRAEADAVARDAVQLGLF